MKTWTTRLGLSLMIVLGFWTNRLPAQEQLLLPPPYRLPVYDQQLLIVPTIPYEPALQPPASYPLLARPQPVTNNSLVHRTMNGHGVACGIDPYSVPCGNWHYEMNFIFGSCRYFFNDSCPSCRSYPQRFIP